MIEFKKYEGSETLNDLGTLGSQLGKTGTIDFNKTNFHGPKRVVVIAKDGKGLSAVVSCSSNLSAHLRKLKAEGVAKEQLLAFVAGLNVLENEEGIPYITMPAGERSEGFKIADLAKVNLDAKITELADIPW